MSLIIRSLKEVWIVPWTVVKSVYFWILPRWWNGSGPKWSRRKVVNKLANLYRLRCLFAIEWLFFVFQQLQARCYLGQLNFQLRIAIFIHNFRVWYFLNRL